MAPRNVEYFLRLHLDGQALNSSQPSESKVIIRGLLMTMQAKQILASYPASSVLSTGSYAGQGRLESKKIIWGIHAFQRL